MPKFEACLLETIKSFNEKSRKSFVKDDLTQAQWSYMVLRDCARTNSRDVRGTPRKFLRSTA
jgi:hypothetical protein